MVGSPSFIELQRTQPISAEKLPLPDGAATSANQLSLQTVISGTMALAGATASSAITIQGNSAGTPVPVSLSAGATVLLASSAQVVAMGTYHATPPAYLDGTSASLQIDTNGYLKSIIQNWPTTQPVSGTVGISGTVAVSGTFWQTTQPVSLASSPAVPQGTPAANTAGWPVTSGQQADTTGTFTNATQTTSVTTGSLLGYETVTVSISGTYGTATGVFEVSDDGGTTWYAAQAARSDSATVDSGYTALTNINRLWILPVNGADQFRVRSTAVASGTVNVRISPSAASTADSAIVSVANTVAAQGDVASAAADSGNPQKIGGLAKTANPAAVADGQRVNAVFDKLGKLVVVHSLRELRGVQQTTIGVNTETTIVSAGAAGVFNDLYALVIANTSATAVNVTLKDATGGTTRCIFQIPASATTICFQLPASDGIPQAAAAANWTLTSSAAVTSLQVMALYVKNL